MFVSRLVLAVACLLPLGTFAADPPVIKKVHAPATSPSAGLDMFKQYCSACHGVDGRGQGPATPALKAAPPDLTSLSKNNHGNFPEAHVYSAIKGDVNLPAHGSKDMPVWGQVFHDMSNNSADDRQTPLRISNLCLYIKSLQQK
jgi:mono/diheme cytochrome c family protein